MFLAFKVVRVSGLICTLAGASLFAQSIAPSGEAQEGSATNVDLNINSRYTIESINFVDHHEYKLSPSALDEIRHLVGAK